MCLHLVECQSSISVSTSSRHSSSPGETGGWDPLVGRRWGREGEERNADGSQQFLCIHVMDSQVLIPLCLEQEAQKYSSGQTGVSLCCGSWWWSHLGVLLVGSQDVTMTAHLMFLVLPPSTLLPSLSQHSPWCSLIRSSNRHAWLCLLCVSPFCLRLSVLSATTLSPPHSSLACFAAKVSFPLSLCSPKRVDNFLKI